MIKQNAMSFKLETRPLAAIEILEAYDWYELAKEGLGLEFFKRTGKLL